MNVLHLSLFGSFSITLAGKQLDDLGTDKARAIFAYLTLEPERAHPRRQLAGLFWPDASDKQARQSLRSALYRLRQSLDKAGATLEPPIQLSEQLLLISHQTVALQRSGISIQLSDDVEQFRAHLAAVNTHSHDALARCADCLAALEQAAALYQGELLAGFGLADAPEFEEWLLLQREMLHQQALRAFERLATAYEFRGDYENAANSAHKLLALDAFRETTHRLVMRLLTLRGLPDQALAQFASCRQLMMNEFGAEPEAETVALAERIRRGELHDAKRTGWQEDKPDLSRDEGMTSLAEHPVAPFPAPAVTLSSSRHDWSEMPVGSPFFGRADEIAQLERWLVVDRCRLVSILAIGGMGKTSLAAQIVPTIAEHFDLVIWRSLLNAPPLEELLDTILPILSNQQIGTLPDNLEQQLKLLFGYLQEERVLLVLDNLESILQADAAGQYQVSHVGYGQLLHRMATQQHQGQLLLTSREQPSGIKRLERDMSQVRALHLRGLDESAGNQLLVSRGLSGTTGEEIALTARYSGNPLALKLVADTVQDLFLGNIQEFLAEESLIFDDVRRVLDQHFARLNALEREILFWLAIERMPVDVPTLRTKLLQAPVGRSLLEALNSLQHRSLIERQTNGFALQNVITEYLTDRLVAAAVQELVDGPLHLLHHHAFINVHAKEYIRQSQVRLLLRPVAEQFVAQFGHTDLKNHIEKHLNQLRTQESGMSNYAAGNILNLLLYLQDDNAIAPTGYDFSSLTIRQAFLRGKTLHGYNFARAVLSSSVFTETFGTILALAVQPNGRLLAAGTFLGPIYLYSVDDAQPLGVLQWHEELVLSLAFSPDGKRLASASADGTVALWDFPTLFNAETNQVETSPVADRLLKPRLLLRGHTGWVHTVAFSPDGNRIASGGVDQTVRLWDSRTNELIHTLGGDAGRVYTVTFSPDGQTLASGSVDRKIHLWNVQTGIRRAMLSYPTESQGGTFGDHTIAFSPDGQTLAGSPENTIYLWSMSDVADDNTANLAQVRQICHGHSDWISDIIFSPSGDTLASTSFDSTVRLWDVATGNARYVLSGHTNQLNAVAFSPDGQTVISGGADETIRFWDAESGQPRQILQGYTNHNAGVAFSPDGNTFATANADNMVRLWDMKVIDASQNETMPMPQRLLGHTDSVMTVAFHPDGHLLASGGYDQTILLWDRQTRQPVHKLRGHTNCVRALAFAPDGQTLASSSYDLTARLWDVETGQMRHTLQGHKDWILSLVISPDGKTVATASDTVRLWDIESGTLIDTLPAQASIVYDLAFSPDGKVLVAGYLNQAVCIWDMQTRQKLDDLYGHTGFVNFVAFSPDGQTFVSGNASHWMHLWQANDDAEPVSLRHVSISAIKIAFSPDSQFFVSGGDETIKLWQSATGECIKTLRIPGPYHEMNITGVTGINQAQKVAFKALGAVEE